MTIACIVGLGNPGPEYDHTRHNAGFDFVDELARRFGGAWQTESKFFGQHCRIAIGSQQVRLLKPTTFMNRSGQSVLALQQFYKLPVEQLLVAHDELDLPPGVARLKRAGGHGGHNGLRDISNRLNPNYLRLRLGIGHPGHRDKVVGYVLKRANKEDQQQIDHSIDDAANAVELLIKDGLEKAQQQLHSRG